MVRYYVEWSAHRSRRLAAEVHACIAMVCAPCSWERTDVCRTGRLYAVWFVRSVWLTVIKKAIILTPAGCLVTPKR